MPGRPQIHMAESGPAHPPTAPARRRPVSNLPSSDRLLFRPWDEADFELARGLWGNPEVMRYLSQGGAYSDQQVRDRLARETAALGAIGVQYWPIFLRDTGEFAGCSGLKVCPYAGSTDAPELELGFHLMPSMWGRGLASDAGAAVARFAFEQLGLARVYAGHHPQNDASRHVLTKLGFRYEKDVFFEPTGEYHPLYVMENPGTANRSEATT